MQNLIIPTKLYFLFLSFLPPALFYFFLLLSLNTYFSLPLSISLALFIYSSLLPPSLSLFSHVNSSFPLALLISIVLIFSSPIPFLCLFPQKLNNILGYTCIDNVLEKGSVPPHRFARLLTFIMSLLQLKGREAEVLVISGTLCRCRNNVESNPGLKVELSRRCQTAIGSLRK